MRDLTEAIPPMALESLKPDTIGMMWMRSAVEKAYKMGQEDMKKQYETRLVSEKQK